MDHPYAEPVEREQPDPSVPAPSDDDWVSELIAMTRPGIEIDLFPRALHDRIIPFQYDDFS